MRKLITISLVLVMLLLGVWGCSSTPSSPTGTAATSSRVILNEGAVSSAGELFVSAVAISGTINKYAPGISVTVVELGGAEDIVNMVGKGVVQFGNGVIESAQALYTGTGQYQGKGNNKVRGLWLYDVNLTQIYVRKDVATKENIKTFSDFAGKTWAPGSLGSSTLLWYKDFIKLLNLNTTVFEASRPDAIRSLREGKIVAYALSGPRDRFDASMLEVHQTVPLTLVGYTKEQADAMAKAFPAATGSTFFPKGGCKDAPDAGDFWVRTALAGVWGTTGISQDVAYRMVKAIDEHWADAGDIYSPFKSFKSPVAEFIPMLTEGRCPPLHAGTVQYCKEKGIQVPAYLIPPEYKDK